MGITRVNLRLNRTDMEHPQINIISSSEDSELVTINYTVLNIGPQLNYVFIADLLSHFNKSKTKNSSYFSECFCHD